MISNWRRNPPTKEQMEKLRFFGCTWDEGITAGQASDALEECARMFPDAEATYQRNLPSTETQKDWLHFFGCTWNGEVTVAQADEALAECAREFPDKQKEAKKWFSQIDGWKKRQNANLQQEVPITKVGASHFEAVNEFEDRQNFIERTGRANDPVWQKWARQIFPRPSRKKVVPVPPKLPGVTESPQEFLVRTGRINVEAWQRWAKAKQTSPPELANQEDNQAENFSAARWCSECGESKTIEHNGQQWCPICGKFVRLPAAKKIAQFNRQTVNSPRAAKEDLTYEEARHMSQAEWHEWIGLHGSYGTEPGFKLTFGAVRMMGEKEWQDWRIASNRLSEREKNDLFRRLKKTQAERKKKQKFLRQQEREGYKKSNQPFAEEITIQAAAKSQISNPNEFIIPAREVQSYGQRRPAIRQPAACKATTPIERFEESLDDLLEKNQTIKGGHWLPIGPLNHVFPSDAITTGMCRQIAHVIESKGYCVEPDVRFGGGTYDRNQTLALFKPLSSEIIKPSTAYLGAANLLRLCILIATADGRIDVVELEAFRLAIEKQGGLSQTDHKRLVVLEQLLAQELCSPTKTVARIAKTVSAENRFAVGKLLVDVAAANDFVTSEERCALGRIFEAFQIPSDTLDKWISRACPKPRNNESNHDIYYDVSSQNKWRWNHWRTGHPGVVIDDDTLAHKSWNFTDWKALNSRWRLLYERLDATQQLAEGAEFGSSSEMEIQQDHELRKSNPSWCDQFEAARRNPSLKEEQASKPVPQPKHFSLDMDKVYTITNETKEVIGILSVLMSDEPEKSISLPTKDVTTTKTPEIPSASKTLPERLKFDGLDPAFHPILERLLLAESWAPTDFGALANEFHFMPGKIVEALNEWADEALGDFILDGENPIIVRRDLIETNTT